MPAGRWERGSRVASSRDLPRRYTGRAWELPSYTTEYNDQAVVRVSPLEDRPGNDDRPRPRQGRPARRDPGERLDLGRRALARHVVPAGMAPREDDERVLPAAARDDSAVPRQGRFPHRGRQAGAPPVPGRREAQPRRGSRLRRQARATHEGVIGFAPIRAMESASGPRATAR